MPKLKDKNRCKIQGKKGRYRNMVRVKFLQAKRKRQEQQKSACACKKQVLRETNVQTPVKAEKIKNQGDQGHDKRQDTDRKRKAEVDKVPFAFFLLCQMEGPLPGTQRRGIWHFVFPFCAEGGICSPLNEHMTIRVIIHPQRGERVLKI